MPLWHEGEDRSNNNDPHREQFQRRRTIKMRCRIPSLVIQLTYLMLGIRSDKRRKPLPKDLSKHENSLICTIHTQNHPQSSKLAPPNPFIHTLSLQPPPCFIALTLTILLTFTTTKLFVVDTLCHSWGSG